MIYVFLYLVAIILANLSVTAFRDTDYRDAVVIVNAFLFIGLDLTARDRLHDAWRGRKLFPKMAGLIAAGSLLSWLLNRNSADIALASFTAFAAAATVDALVYHRLGSYPRWLRVNGSNIPSAAVDSVVFPSLAFPGFPWGTIIGQFLAKALGGFVWSLLFRLSDRRVSLSGSASSQS
jgi:hypothetical protein